jgi:hypothetical protein
MTACYSCHRLWVTTVRKTLLIHNRSSILDLSIDVIELHVKGDQWRPVFTSLTHINSQRLTIHHNKVIELIALVRCSLDILNETNRIKSIRLALSSQHEWCATNHTHTLLSCCWTDTEIGVLLGLPKSAICVQRFDDSLNSAIRITYRISLRSSSLREPRYPLLRVVF